MLLHENICRSINTSTANHTPWQHYNLVNLLTEEAVNFINSYPFPGNEQISSHPSNFCLLRKFDRLRSIITKDSFHETLKDNRHSCEVNFTDKIIEEHDIFNQIFNAFRSQEVLDSIEERGKNTLRGKYLRIQLLKDIPGYSIIPHVDECKAFTLQAFFCTDGEYNLGTSFHTVDNNCMINTPYEENCGSFFFPGKNTWHSFTGKIINRRISLMVNYFNVIPDNSILNPGNIYYKIC
jgi:hypothetical protein